MKNRLSILLVLLLLVTPLAGCQNSESASTDQTEVTVILDWVPNTNHTGLYVARDKGFYEAEGLNVKIIQPSEGGASALIAAGQGDFGISYQEELTIARSKGIPVIALAAVIQHNTSGFASPKDRNIKTPKDFEGKTYGGWGSPAETAVIKALMDKFDADINKVNMLNTADTDYFTSIKTGTDFAWIYWGWTGIESQLKNIDLDFIPVRDEYPALDFYTPVIIASESKIAAEPLLVEKFMRATTRGYEYTIQNPEPSAEILLKAIPELDRELVLASQAYLSKEYQSDAPRWGEMKLSVWKDYADFMFNNNLIEKNIEPEKAFTNKFLPERE
ncbi:MAG: ABC transporter substrate-binding protein [Syntrophomonadaceae bacterium]|jgi:ABC-type nitrate/sulfonate/bicarbonate transport system substrate-binding protein